MGKRLPPLDPLPEIHGYWDKPKTKDKGDPDINLVFRAVGESLSAWEYVETSCAMLFGLFVEGETIAAQRAYGAIASHSGRREALQEAAEIFLSMHAEESKPYFDLLMKHFAAASGRRNEIAHGVVHSFTINDQNRGVFLVPTSYNSRKTEAQTLAFWLEVTKQNKENPFRVFGGLYRYTSSDIEHFTKLFTALSKQVNRFHIRHLMQHAQKKFDALPDNQKASVQLGQKKDDPPQKTG